jgi:hypothetical protein
MKKNIGNIDRILRIAFALVVAVLYLTDQVTGIAGIILGVLSIIFFVTALVGTCPLYMIFGVSTGRREPMKREGAVS